MGARCSWNNLRRPLWRGGEGPEVYGQQGRLTHQRDKQNSSARDTKPNDYLPINFLRTRFASITNPTRRPDESITEIQGSSPITVNIFLYLSMKTHLDGWFWNFSFNITWAVLALFLSIRGCIGFGEGCKLGREQVYDRTGHTRPAFHFLGDSAWIVHLKDDFLSLSLFQKVTGWNSERDERRWSFGKDFGKFGGGR